MSEDKGLMYYLRKNGLDDAPKLFYDKEECERTARDASGYAFWAGTILGATLMLILCLIAGYTVS